MQPSMLAHDGKNAPRNSLSSSSSFKTVSSSASLGDDVGRMGMLLKNEALQTLFQDVKPTNEPVAPRQPGVLQIQYSRAFDYVMGLYRTMSAKFSGIGSPSSARWFLLTAFVLCQCNGHYTGWKDRRDVVLESARLLSSTREDLLVKWGTKEENSSGNEERLEKLMPLVENWLPAEAELKGPTGSFSEWRAVRWELNAVKCFNLNNHKNFQVWHHRKELLLEALARTDSPSRTSDLASMGLFDKYLIEHHGVHFRDIDERSLCNEVLNMDHKNYHVWLHRLWFVHAFYFLVQPPSWTALLNSYAASAGQREKSTAPLRQFVVQEKWEEYCLESNIPPCGLKDELGYTAVLIRDDNLNNSAWCHRFYLFDHDLIGVLLQTSSQHQPNDVEKVLRELCLDEMHYALQWCVYEPCNESSFVHARGVANVYQSAALRFYLSRDATGAYHNCLADRGPISSMEPLPSHYMCLKKKVPWDVFLATFSLMQQQLCVLRENVAPRAEEHRSRASASDNATVRMLHNCRSQFLLDNVYQVYAALYHGLFVLLEHLWCCYFTETERRCVNEVLPPEKYAEGAEAAAGIIKTQQLEYCVRFFLEHEVQAMELARRLVVEDSIRSKYWKNEIKIVMHRDYI
ncbi:putative protein farnesyltransferase alpha subunit [Trypanosoma cruzi]|uniref:Protein farnesyltransferase/geranylgeranyltransferase type-1 subunit alpha n=2 Tax=Trypanosoma cruzi TaxID=5693 RepID=Q4E3I5_TRYCC|nr:protein farnesyltransferase alpha subunit, putative [Trypanosoma cruzi]AAL69904.1 farnesyltransferase alpha subunit [Trypanosoma cruzi]EAN99354.1 protein farnesyltransferase alpha subunit, putative [Trypanosoma cruzi]PWU91960.1 putative protein farnesyltransferase alpha subunit [Trypanosoma cruzi]RNC42631.1 putative protein farnesyltransferase alpha subunit [Trypanosoma cruzi]|eukprot:XP_821205.1 protein farnesyltransferase alpha subunit [Trypanosoma cruzi strain CL Brener]